MAAGFNHEITQLLVAWGDGDPNALERLTPFVYDELHRLAKYYMSGEKAGHVLQTSALVNEAYLKLVDSSKVKWQNRAHFLAVSARMMRRILVDFARSQKYQKRGGGMIQVSLAEAMAVSLDKDKDLVALDEALEKLASVDERKSKVVELRFFGGLSVEETAEALRVSPDTVMRDWKFAKVWLLRELSN